MYQVSFFLIFVVGWKDFRAYHTNTIIIPIGSIQHTVVLLLLQSFVLEQQYGNLGGKPVTAEEVVAWEVGKILTVKFVEHSNNTNGVCELKHEQKWATVVRIYMCCFL